MPERRHFFYSLIQYVHSRREERLNVGVIVHDPVDKNLKVSIDAGSAVRRLRLLFPDIDSVGTRHYLAGLPNAIQSDRRVVEATPDGNVLHFLSAEWQNVIQFTPPRPYPATDMLEALSALLRIYVTEPPSMSRSDENRGVKHATKRTVEAIQAVLNLPRELGWSSFDEERTFFHNGQPYKIPIKFPFFVLDRFVIDTLSFDSSGQENPQKEASQFIEKVTNLRSLSKEIQPFATVSIDNERPDFGRALIANVLEKTKLPDQAIVEADRAEDMVRYIKDQSQQAA